MQVRHLKDDVLLWVARDMNRLLYSLLDLRGCARAIDPHRAQPDAPPSVLPRAWRLASTVLANGSFKGAYVQPHGPPLAWHH